MIAIVDREAKLRIVIGTTPSPGLRGGIDNLNFEPRFNQSNRGRKAGKSRSDDRRSSKTQPVTTSRATVKSSAGLLIRTRGRGGTHPILSIRFRSFE